MKTVAQFFEDNNNEFLKSEKYMHLAGVIQQMYVFSALAEYGMHQIVTSVTHDTIWLGGDPNVLFERWGEDKTLDMIRCGLLYDEDCESFYMFV